MNRVQKWSARLSQSRHGLALIGLASFLETIIVPIPIELVLIPYMVANRERVWLIATVTTVACLAAAVIGYGFGYFLFNSAGQWLIQTFGYEQAYAVFTTRFDQHGFWAIVAIGVVPIPFQVAMIVAGVAGYPLYLFLLASALARGIRYYGLALLVVAFGRQALVLWQAHSKTVGVGLLVVFVAVFFGVKFLPSVW